MSLSVTVTPGYTFGPTEEVTNTKLNQAATPTVNLAGAAGSASISDGAVTTTKLADGAVTTAKLADGGVTAAKLASDALAATQLAPVATAKNLAVVMGASPTHQVAVTADELVLANASGLKHLATTVSVTLDVATSGAGGRDTGSEAASTWYYIWVLYDATGNTVSGVLSTASALSSVTLPGSYTYGALVGAVRNDGSSNFINFTQQGREVYWNAEQAIFDATNGGLSAPLSGAALTAFQAAVPSIAKMASGDLMIQASGIALHARVAGSSGLVGRALLSGESSASQYDNAYGSASFKVPLFTYNLYWDTLTSNNHRMVITGFTLGINAV